MDTRQMSTNDSGRDESRDYNHSTTIISQGDDEERQLQQPSENSTCEDGPNLNNLNTQRNFATTRDPCGTPRIMKDSFARKVYELDSRGIATVPSVRSEFQDEEDEQPLIPMSNAPEITKPKIVESSFEDEIKKLLKSLEEKFPVRGQVTEKISDKQTDYESKEVNTSSISYDEKDENDDAHVPEDSDIVCPFDGQQRVVSVEEDIANVRRILENLDKDPDMRMIIDDDFESQMVEESEVNQGGDGFPVQTDDQAGPSRLIQEDRLSMESALPSSRRTVKTALDFEKMDISDDEYDEDESSAHVPSESDEMVMLPSLDSEDNRILADIELEINQLPLSEPTQNEVDTEFAVPATVSEDGVVLPVVETLFDDTSTVPGGVDDETTTSGTFYEEALLPEVPEENSLSGSLMNDSELNLENESIQSGAFNENTQSDLPIHHRESTLSNMFHGTSDSVSSSPRMLRFDVMPNVDELFSPDSVAFSDEDQNDSRDGLPSNNHVVPSSLPVVNTKSNSDSEERMMLPTVPDEDTEELLRNLGALPKAGTVSLPGQRRYDNESVITWEEDQLREFKGHRNVSAEEVPPWCLVEPRTRSPISRNICGFLNTGMGGTIYVGILNNGLVRGEAMTSYQQDHFLLSLRDALQRFRPPVPLHLVKTTFVPVLHPWDRLPDESSCSSLQCDEELRLRPHKLQTHISCWCDWEATARIKQGILSRKYVVEITVLPVDPDDPLLSHMKPSSDIRTRPTFQADDAQIYFRKHASTIKCSMRDIEESAKDEVLLYKMPQLMTAWRQYLTYKKLTEVVEEALSREGEGDSELVSHIREVERAADQSTYRLVQERHVPYYH